MAIKHLTYLDLTDEQRRDGAAEARGRLQGYMATPWLTSEQKAVVADELARVGAWEHGRIPVVHEVEVVEAVGIDTVVT